MFSSIWNERSGSGNRRSRACRIGTPRNSAISAASSGCALPENTFSSPNPIGMKGSPISGASSGWLGREDSNLRIRDPKSRALPLGHAPKTFSPLASLQAPARLARQKHFTARLAGGTGSARTPKAISPLASPEAPARLALLSHHSHRRTGQGPDGPAVPGAAGQPPADLPRVLERARDAEHRWPAARHQRAERARRQERRPHPPDRRGGGHPPPPPPPLQAPRPPARARPPPPPRPPPSP